jgi:nitroreductase
MLAVRSYTNQPIDPATVTRIVQAARLTGSSRNRQEWDFIIVQDKAMLKKLGEHASTGPYIADAPLAIVIVVPKAPVGYIDGARAAQDMMLAAWGEGIGSNWVSNLDTDEVKELLKVPGDKMILAVLPFGYPTEEIGAGKKTRKPLSEIVHAERFGQPYQE